MVLVSIIYPKGASLTHLCATVSLFTDKRKGEEMLHVLKILYVPGAKKLQEQIVEVTLYESFPLGVEKREITERAVAIIPYYMLRHEMDSEQIILQIVNTIKEEEGFMFLNMEHRMLSGNERVGIRLLEYTIYLLR